MIRIVKKYLIPNEENEYKPHIFRKTAVAVIASFVVFIFALGVFQGVIIQKTDWLSAVIARTLVDLANDNRTEYSLKTLAMNDTLTEAAQKKANDMASKGYFAHNSPQGLTPWYWFKEVGYQYQYAGENLAVNFSDSVDVDSAWMASPGHRANILNGKFTEIGIATSKGLYNGRETTFVVQMFGKPLYTRPASVLVNTNSQQVATATTTVATTTASTSVPTEVVLGETESFISIDNSLAGEEIPTVVSENQESANIVEEAVSSPKRTVSLVYIFLSLFLLLALVLTVFIEIKRQHSKHIVAGIFLITLILVLAYVFREMLSVSVVVV